MTPLQLELSGAGFLLAVGAAVVLVLALRLLRRLLDALPANGAYQSAFRRTFPVTESLVWVLFTVWAIGFVFVDQLSQSLALLTLLVVSVVWLSWFAARDFIAGVILKLQDAYEIGQRIHVNDIEGSILGVGFLGMDIVRTDGEVTRIPYSKITGAIHSRRLPAASSHYHFQVEVPRQGSGEATAQQIRESAMMSPWSSPESEPQVRCVSETDDTYTFEVAVSGIGPDQVQAIERDVRSHLHI